MKWLMQSSVVALLLAPTAAIAQSGASHPFPCSGAPAPASLASPFAMIAVNSTCVDLTRFIHATTPGEAWSFDADVTVGATSLRVVGSFDADPFLTFAATTNNPVAGPVSYAFLFGTPVTPDFYNSATSTAGVSVTDGVGGLATVTTSGLASTYVTGYGSDGSAITDLGVGLGTEPCVASGRPLAVTTTCAQGTTANGFAPAFYNSLYALLTYDQSDVASTASWSGAVTLEAAPNSTVPEPSSLLLVAGGLAATGAAAAKRRRSSELRPRLR